MPHSTHGDSAKLSSYKALLNDTLDLLGKLSYADEASRVAAQIQAEEIRSTFPELSKGA